jgi:hypothetical protein
MICSFKNYQGFQLKPEYYQYQGDDQFRHHFDIAFDNSRALKTHYDSEFYKKNNEKV